jgi:hypothetical protein
MPGASGSLAGDSRRGQLRRAQQLVPAEQVGRPRDVRPAAELADRGGASAPAGERRRERVEHGGAVDRQPRGTGVAEDHPVAGVQRQRVAQPQPGVDGRWDIARADVRARVRDRGGGCG